MTTWILHWLLFTKLVASHTVLLMTLLDCIVPIRSYCPDQMRENIQIFFEVHPFMNPTSQL